MELRSQWPRGLRRRSTAARLLRSWDRIPPRAWMFVCCECCVLSGRGLCDGLIIRSEESYRLWRVVVCDHETSQARRLKPARAPGEKKDLVGPPSCMRSVVMRRMSVQETPRFLLLLLRKSVRETKTLALVTCCSVFTTCSVAGGDQQYCCLIRKWSNLDQPM